MEPKDLLAIVESKPVTDEEFNEAAEKAKTMKDMPNDHLLQIYGLFKQATVGKVNTSRPWAINVVDCAKWDSWKKYESWTKEQAKAGYVYVINNAAGH